MSPPLVTHWTEAEDAILQRMLGEGATARMVAAHLAEAGFPIRNRYAVIARARRLREGPARPPKAPRVKGDRPKARKKSAVKPIVRINSAQKAVAAAQALSTSYRAPPVVAGLPTVVIRVDLEGNPIAPVTLRRVTALEVRI